MRAWFCLLLLVLGCDDGGGADVDAASTGSDAINVADAARDVGAADSSVADAAPDVAQDPRCRVPCARLVECAADRCAVDDPTDACVRACTRTPDFVETAGALDCDALVQYAVFTLDRDFAEACLAPRPGVPDGSGCPWPCVGDEVCVNSRCLRPDGSCDTDYHCLWPGEECFAGQCRTRDGASCSENPAVCREDQYCAARPRPNQTTLCYRACVDDAGCPIDEVCFDQDYCAVPTCTAAELYGACTIAGAAGTCFPTAVGFGRDEEFGVCLDAGTAEVDDRCDAQAESRADGALRCVPGARCVGDRDNPLDPNRPPNTFGTCAQLCDPRGADCPAGRVCFDFGTPDDPATEFDETLHLGACLSSDCDVLQGGCPAGQGCRLIGVQSTAGSCGPAGRARVGDPCGSAAECAGDTACDFDFDGEKRCMTHCDPEAPDCAAGTLCFSRDGWRVGYCVPS